MKENLSWKGKPVRTSYNVLSLRFLGPKKKKDF